MQQRAAPLANPYVVGQWVRGQAFYGREALIAEILDGRRNCVWLLGARRVGKTSLLKQLEHLTASLDRGFFPLFWDFQGAETSDELSLDFGEALLDAEERLEKIGVAVPEVSGADLFSSLGRLRRRLCTKHLTLLLLCDEVEELIRLGEMDPALLRKLRRAVQAEDGIRSVLAASIRLWTLGEHRQDTSPFLHGLLPPLYLQRLAESESRALIRQDHLAAGCRPRFDDADVETIRRRCGDHPHLIQLLAKRCLELEDLDEACAEVAADPTVRHFFAVDVETLSGVERGILRFVSEHASTNGDAIRGSLPMSSGRLDDGLQRLANLGLLRRDNARRFTIANDFFRRWLRDRPPRRPRGGDKGEDLRPSGSKNLVTSIVESLEKAGGGTDHTSEELLPLVYDELRRVSRGYLRRERPGHTLQATALVHEAYLKMVDHKRVGWQGRSHFFAVGARAMRRLLIDHARGRQRGKRGGDLRQVTLNEAVAPFAGRDLDFEQLLTLDAALERLRRLDQRRARIVELRFFSGLTIEEVAHHLGLSKRTVNTEWSRARAWLECELRPEGLIP